MEELGNDSTWIANRYECLEELGEGSTGKVWLTQDHVRNETVALRWIDEEIIEGLKKNGNVVTFFSIEGYEPDTDHWRGKGVFKSITES